MLDLLFPSPVAPKLHLNPFSEDTEALRVRELTYIDAIHAACPYNTPEIKQAIHLFKYRRMPSLGFSLSQLLLQAKFSCDENTVLCPVPLHWSRQFWRGFNQAEHLAKKVGEARTIPVRSLLRRVRPTGHQAHRNREERLHAMQNAFVCTEKITASTIILLDDLATTGATLDACADALKSAGVERVEGWVVAHG